MNVMVRNGEIEITLANEVIKITACGNNAIRFQAFPGCKVVDTNYNLMPCSVEAEIEQSENCVSMRNGALLVAVKNGEVQFYINKKCVISEKREHTFGGKSRQYRNVGHETYSADVSFEPSDEKLFGMGHSWDNEFDLKGTVHDIKHINAKSVIPYVYSSQGYGFLWNVPSIGRVEFAKNRTRWHSDCCKAVDYVVIAGSPKETSEVLADLTGHAPVMPDWATGFWQSRLRYETQDEVLSVVRRYRELNIPLSAIIIDYFHWTEQGDYKFDPKYWPDVKAMADEIHEGNTKLLVSMWPTVNERSENYKYMYDNNMLIRTANGSNKLFDFYGWQAEIDVANPRTREFVWGKLKESYADKGVDAFWFDVSEPEIYPEHFDNCINYNGRYDMTALTYPVDYARLVYEGQKAMGRDDIVTLIRGGYFGSQKYASLVWSGDTASTFESLERQVYAAQNMAMCGIVWWNTDIGGFYGGDTTSEYFRELIVRWFQFGLFCPVMRLHGNRVRHSEDRPIIEQSGDPNEIWSFGEQAFEIIKGILATREKLRPYISEQMKIASQKGWPIIRPMFFEFPDDKNCWETKGQYMFGEDILFAPVTKQGAKSVLAYLPKGKWVLTKNGKEYCGERLYEIDVEINEYVAFVKKGSKVLECFK